MSVDAPACTPAKPRGVTPATITRGAVHSQPLAENVRSGAKPARPVAVRNDRGSGVEGQRPEERLEPDTRK